MNKLLLLIGIIIAKVLITKGIALVSILLSFILKGKRLQKSTLEWNDYILTLGDTFVDKYTKIIYIISTVLSAWMIFMLFKLFKFQYPVSLTFIILTICALISWYRYQKNGKIYIQAKFHEVKESIKSDNMSNHNTL
ncbi:MAG: hypothetical protein KHZ72_03580 [Lachnospiraceae bacterium]|nr:hypothetical protein [Lachnospiraceae bacterium]